MGREVWVENRARKEESFLGVFGKKYPEAKQGPGGEGGVDAQTWGQRGWLLVLYLLRTRKIPGPEQEPLQGRQRATEVIFISVQTGSTKTSKRHAAASADVHA